MLLAVAGVVSAPDAKPLSLEDLVDRVEAFSPQVLQAASLKRTVEAARVGARQIFPGNPQLSVSAGHRHDSSGSRPPSTGVEWDARLEQTLEVGGQRRLRISEIEHSVEAADAHLRVARVEARARARQAYVRVLFADTLYESAEMLHELSKRFLGDAQKRSTSGASSDLERLLAEEESGRAQADMIGARLETYRSRVAVRVLGRYPPETAHIYTTPFTQPVFDVADTNALFRRALEFSPVLGALAREQAAIEATMRRLHREAVPSPTVFFESMRQQPGQLYFGGGIMVPLPIWQRKQGELAVFTARIGEVMTARTNTVTQLLADIDVARRAVQAHAEQYRLTHEVVLPATSRRVAMVREAWRAGKLDFLHVTQGLRGAAQARRDEAEDLADLWNSVIDLQRLCGDT